MLSQRMCEGLVPLVMCDVTYNVMFAERMVFKSNFIYANSMVSHCSFNTRSNVLQNISIGLELL